MRIQELLKTIRNSYELQISKLSLVEIVRSYSKIETDLREDITNILEFELKEAGFNEDKTILVLPPNTVHHHSFHNRNFQMDEFIQFNSMTRELNIVLAINSKPTDKLLNRLHQFNSIGRIGKISFSFSQAANRLVEECFSLIVQLITYVYALLERRILSVSNQLLGNSISRLYDVIYAHASAESKDKLIPEIRLFLFKEKAGYFYFSREAIEKALKIFKEHQMETFAPVDYLFWLFTSPLPYIKSATRRSEESRTQTFTQIIDGVEYYDEAEFYRLMKQLYSADRGYRVIIACLIDQYKLSVVFPMNSECSERQMSEFLLPIKKTLNDIFSYGLEEYNNLVETIRIEFTKPKLSHPKINSIFANFLEITVEVLKHKIAFGQF